MQQQIYTVERADRTLPLVRRIVEDIVQTYARWQQGLRARELLAATERADAPGDDAARLERDLQRMARDIDGFVAELAALGVTCKDLGAGLVDFPGEIDGRPVWLCWRLGEPSVQYWHELDAGYADRRPLDPEMMTHPRT